MQLFAVSRTEQGIRERGVVTFDSVIKDDPIVPALIERRSTLLKQCAEASADLKRQKAKNEALKAEADRQIKAANLALRALHARWAEEAEREGRKQWKHVPHPMSIDEIKRRVCKALKVSHLALMSESREEKVVMAKHAVFYWAARRTGHSIAQLGRMMGKDHTTVLHGMKVYPKKRAKMGRTLRDAR